MTKKLKLKLKVKKKRKSKKAKDKEVLEKLPKVKVTFEYNPKSRRRIPLDVVERMFELYCQEYPVRAIAEETGAAVPTVTKYINEGDPERQVEPLRDRRARVLQALFAQNEEALNKRMSHHTKLNSAGFGQAAARIIRRYQAAEALDDATLLSDKERALYERIALEPDLADVSTFHRNSMDLMRLSLGLRDTAPVNINVSQNQEQTQDQGADISVKDQGDIEIVYEHIQALSRAGEKDEKIVANTVKRASLRTEGTLENEDPHTPTQK